MFLLSRVKQLIKSLMLLPVVLKLLVRFFRVTAITGKGSDVCLESGFLPVPINYHSPIPDIGDLEKRKIWDVCSELIGIDFRVDEQVELLVEFGRKYSEECQWALTATENPSEFYVQNPSFSYGCAASTHCMIRHFKPRVFIEIGSGMSSMVISAGLGMNRSKGYHDSRYIIVDPYPADWVKDGSIEKNELVGSRVELLDPVFFEQLGANDILLIDSGHCVRMGGDVNFLFLDILPRLDSGVIVHIHDVNLPYEYPKTYATSETFRQFWTEQYLLQSFLCFNSEFEILLAMHYLMTDHFETFRRSFPFYNPDNHPYTSGSFWIRRRLRHRA